jgi:hypothetical protein
MTVLLLLLYYYYVFWCGIVWSLDALLHVQDKSIIETMIAGSFVKIGNNLPDRTASHTDDINLDIDCVLHNYKFFVTSSVKLNRRWEDNAKMYLEISCVGWAALNSYVISVNDEKWIITFELSGFIPTELDCLAGMGASNFSPIKLYAMI